MRVAASFLMLIGSVHAPNQPRYCDRQSSDQAPFLNVAYLTPAIEEPLGAILIFCRRATNRGSERSHASSGYTRKAARPLSCSAYIFSRYSNACSLSTRQTYMRAKRRDGTGSGGYFPCKFCWRK